MELVSELITIVNGLNPLFHLFLLALGFYQLGAILAKGLIKLGTTILVVALVVLIILIAVGMQLL